MSKYWTEEEKNILVKGYKNDNKAEIMKKLPNRTWSGIKNEAWKLSLQRMNKRHWTKEEDKILKSNFNKIKKEYILKLLPKKTWSAIRNHAYKLNLILPERKMINYKPPLDRVNKLNISEKYKFWLAACIDGEGTLGMLKATRDDKTSYLPYFSIGNTNKEFVKTFKERAKTDHIKIYKKKTGYTNDYYKLETQNLGYVYSISKCLKKYLIVKKKQAELLIEFIEIEDALIRNAGWRGKINYTSRQQKIFKTIRKLNKRGCLIERNMDSRL